MPRGPGLASSSRLRCQVVGVVASLFVSVSVRAAPPSNAEVAQALVDQVHTMVSDLATQRDASGGWPAAVETTYQTLTQAVSQLDSARTAGDPSAVRKYYRASFRIAARITRWLVNHYSPENDELPARDRAAAIVARLTERVDLIVSLASSAKAVIDLTQVNTARTRVQSAMSGGTNVALRDAIRALRDAVDNLQDSLPDAEQ
jgi:hypothetical protein